MTITEAKAVLMLYRPGMAEAEDPQMAEALALARKHPELAGWLEAHGTAQEVLAAKFKTIAPPPGLKEQIISEHEASRRAVAKRPALLVAAIAVLLLAGTTAILWMPWHTRPPEKTLALYRNDMASIALRVYAMELMTNEPGPVHDYLTKSSAPDFTLSAPLQKAALAGCAVETWQGAKVSLVCFRTGKPLPPGAASDLWLFVVDRASLKDAPGTAAPEFAKINKLITATWTQGDKVYLLGVEGDEPDIKPYLD